MPAPKTATLTLRIDPALKEGLRTAAQREHRSIANMVEVLVRDYCERTDIEIPRQPVQKKQGAQEQC
jgi:hypothetical protein